jgi:hypothetical protein
MWKSDGSTSRVVRCVPERVPERGPTCKKKCSYGAIANCGSRSNDGSVSESFTSTTALLSVRSFEELTEWIPAPARGQKAKMPVSGST